MFFRSGRLLSKRALPFTCRFPLNVIFYPEVVKIVYLTHSCPYPPNKGDRIRSFHILRHLAAKHQVTLLYLGGSPDDLSHGDILKRYGVEVCAFSLTPFAAKIRGLLAFLQGKPLTLGYFYSGHLQECLRHMECDLVLADCSSMAQYILHLPNPRMVDFIDVDSEKWNTYAQWSSPLIAWVYRLECRRLGKFEREAVRRADVCFVTSEKERECFGSGTDLLVVPNGVDFEFFDPKPHEMSTSAPTILFMGAMKYFPNIDGVQFFVHEILPLIRQEIPSVKFIVAGMDPVSSIRRLACSHILVTGAVPDMRPYLQAASVCVVPLRIARGVQNKVLEAMAMKVPVVATSVANSGIQAREEHEILLADTPAAFARAVVRVLNDSYLQESLSLKARDFVEQHFSWPHALKQLDVAIELALQKGKIRSFLQ